MRIYIVIPAHNESAYIEETLSSLANQSHQPEQLVVVDDHSTDDTADKVRKLAEQYPFIRLVKSTSTAEHLPGGKVIEAFYKGFETLDLNYDVVCKFDADLIFPRNYLAGIAQHFEEHPRVGMAGGFCQIEKDGKWILEDLTGKDHLRGALKAYRKECFLDIGKFKPSMGWDTVDELLAQYHGWTIKTDSSLLVKHLKPTGTLYSKAAKLRQGEAFYKLHYGLPITVIASAKLAFKKGNLRMFWDYLAGYFSARKRKLPYLVSEKEGAFIRRLRYKKMWGKLFKV